MELERYRQPSPVACGKKNLGMDDETKTVSHYRHSQVFSKCFEINTAHDFPQVGMGRGLVDYYLKSAKHKANGHTSSGLGTLRVSSEGKSNCNRRSPS